MITAMSSARCSAADHETVSCVTPVCLRGVPQAKLFATLDPGYRIKKGKLYVKRNRMPSRLVPGSWLMFRASSAFQPLTIDAIIS